VFGVTYLEPSVFSVSHFKPHESVRGEADDLVLQCRGGAQKVLLAGADQIADYYFPQGESTPDRAFRNPNCAPPADEASPYPFATVHSYGKGTAVYIAGSIFEAYWSYNHHWLRQFFEGIYRYVCPNPAYTVDIPSTVEANLMKTGSGDLLLNLIQYQVGHQGDTSAIPSIEKVYPFHNARCSVKAGGVKEVVLEPEGLKIDFEEKDGYVSFTVPSFTYLAIARIVTA
jgi:hypothetical protein